MSLTPGTHVGNFNLFVQRASVGEVEMPYAGKVVDVWPAGDRAVVSHPSDNRVSLVNLVPLKVLASIPTGRGPDGVAWIP